MVALLSGATFSCSPLRQVLRLAKQGLSVIMPREPKQPGMNKSGEYAGLYAELMELENVSATPSDVLKQNALSILSVTARPSRTRDRVAS